MPGTRYEAVEALDPFFEVSWEAYTIGLRQ